jgi:hypothetical protein
MTPTHVRSMKPLGPLHDLLLTACPPDEEGFKSIPILAAKLEMTAYGIYKWIKASKLPPEQAMRIVEMSEGRTKIEDFHVFVYA